MIILACGEGRGLLRDHQRILSFLQLIRSIRTSSPKLKIERLAHILVLFDANLLSSWCVGSSRFVHYVRNAFELRGVQDRV